MKIWNYKIQFRQLVTDSQPDLKRRDFYNRLGYCLTVNVGLFISLNINLINQLGKFLFHLKTKSLGSSL